MFFSETRTSRLVGHVFVLCLSIISSHKHKTIYLSRKTDSPVEWQPSILFSSQRNKVRATERRQIRSKRGLRRRENLRPYRRRKISLFRLLFRGISRIFRGVVWLVRLVSPLRGCHRWGEVGRRGFGYFLPRVLGCWRVWEEILSSFVFLLSLFVVVIDSHCVVWCCSFLFTLMVVCTHSSLFVSISVLVCVFRSWTRFLFFLLSSR